MPSGNARTQPPVQPVLVEPDAHGQAALLLTESLIHSLVQKASLTNDEAIEVIESAKEVKYEVGRSTGESAKRVGESIGLLSKMASSFATDRV